MHEWSRHANLFIKKNKKNLAEKSKKYVGFEKKSEFIKGDTLHLKKPNDKFGWAPAKFIVGFFFLKIFRKKIPTINLAGIFY